MTDQERLERIEAILRANDLHEPDCTLRQRRESQRFTSMQLLGGPCDCWLAVTT